MPEGVEVKLSADNIRPLMQNNIVLMAEVSPNSRYATKPPEGFVAFRESIYKNAVRVHKIETKGKFMYWTFDNGWFMLCTFGMSGQWSPNKGKHPCLILQYTPSFISSSICEMVFNDPRHFGTIKFTNDAWAVAKKLEELGWDPLQTDFEKSLPWVQYKLAMNKKPIGEVLMDQGIFAGVGNYIRAEALYLSKLNPFRAANKLSADENRRLCQAILDVMQESYKYQGATIQTYKTAYGEEGRYSSCFKVYGQKQDPLGNPIITQDSGGRTLHWCPTIQEGQ